MDAETKPLKERLGQLGLSVDNSVVIGSGILSALGIRDSRDVDVVVDQGTYDRLSNDDRFREEQHHGHPVLLGDDFEIMASWGVLGEDHTLADLAGQSIAVDAVRYITLGFLLEAKRSWLRDGSARQKDIEDVKLIEAYLQLR